MLLGLLLDLIGTVALVPVVGGTMGAYAVDKTLNENKIILTKSYANKEIDWVWGEDPDKFNFQDFIGLTPDEVKFIIPDIKEKEEKAFRKLDYYELNLLFNEQGLCTKVEYLRPKDPNWPYKTHGVFPLENSYTESKMLKIKSTTKYPVYIYRRTSLQTDNADIFYAKIKFSEE